MPLTIVPLGANGSFKIVDEMGVVTGTGRAIASSSHPGYVTLRFDRVGPDYAGGMPVRVPADWFYALDEAERLRQAVMRKK